MKIYTKLLALVISTTVLINLSGCLYQTVNSTDMKKAQYACQHHIGVEQIKADWHGHEYAYCNDGVVFDIGTVAKIDKQQEQFQQKEVDDAVENSRKIKPQV